MSASPITIVVDESTRVSGLLLAPDDADRCFVFAHGAGAGMTHPSMTLIAEALADRRIATLRYQFPYMERGSKRTDPPKVCHATVRAAVAEASRLMSGVPLFAGGRSFGGRMTSQAQATAPLESVVGLVFLAFPLHPPKRPSDERAQHLFDVNIPMLFLQGTRDELAQMDLLEPLVENLGPNATLVLASDADHSFHVPARTGRKDADVRRELLDAMASWMKKLVDG